PWPGSSTPEPSAQWVWTSQHEFHTKPFSPFGRMLTRPYRSMRPPGSSMKRCATVNNDISRPLDRNREVLPFDDLAIFHEEHADAVPRSHEEPWREMVDALIEYHGPSRERVEHFEPIGNFHETHYLVLYRRKTLDRLHRFGDAVRAGIRHERHDAVDVVSRKRLAEVGHDFHVGSLGRRRVRSGGNGPRLDDSGETGPGTCQKAPPGGRVSSGHVHSPIRCIRR